MYKKNLLPLAAILLVSSLAKAEVSTANLGKDVKTGYYNSAVAISESKAGKEAYKQVEEKRLEFATNFKKSEEEYTNKVKDLQAKSSMLSVAAREKAEAEVLKMKREIENKAKEYEEELKLTVNQTQQRLLRELNDSVYEVGRKEGYDVMVDTMSGRVHIINPDKVNSTTSVVGIMDEKYAKLAQANSKSDKKTT